MEKRILLSVYIITNTYKHLLILTKSYEYLLFTSVFASVCQCLHSQTQAPLIILKTKATPKHPVDSGKIQDIKVYAWLNAGKHTHNLYYVNFLKLQVIENKQLRRIDKKWEIIFDYLRISSHFTLYFTLILLLISQKGLFLGVKIPLNKSGKENNYER